MRNYIDQGQNKATAAWRWPCLPLFIPQRAYLSRCGALLQRVLLLWWGGICGA